MSKVTHLTILLVILLLFKRGFAAFAPSLRHILPISQNKILNINTTCDETNLNVTVVFEQPFKGLLFAKDFSQECGSIGKLQSTLFLTFLKLLIRLLLFNLLPPHHKLLLLNFLNYPLFNFLNSVLNLHLLPVLHNIVLLTLFISHLLKLLFLFFCIFFYLLKLNN